MLIPPKVLGLHRMASVDKTRPQLNGVRVARGGDRESRKCFAFATDGKVLATAGWTEDDWAEFPLADADLSPRDHFATTIGIAQAKEWAGHKGSRNHPILDNIALTEKGDQTLVSNTLDSLKKEEVQNPADGFPVEDQFPDLTSLIRDLHGANPTTILNPWRLKQALDTLCSLLPKDKESKRDAVCEIVFRKAKPCWFTVRRGVLDSPSSVSVAVMPRVEV